MGLPTVVLLLVAVTCTWVAGALGTEQQLCGGRGNFNRETQRCDCPWGYGGDNCSQLLLPACRTSLGANASSWTCNSVPAQNCACLRQCWQMYCASQEGGVCVAHVETRARCYELDGEPEEEQISDAPQHDDARARYWEGIFPQDRRNLTREEVTKLYWGNVYAVPNNRCENSCNMRGVCHEDGVAPDQRFCGCHYGYEGRACEAQQGGTCYNECGGNGVCDRGFCHCKEGWWGLDCSRSKVFQPDPHVLPPATRLRVYMYDLPTDLAHDMLFHDPNYISYERFIEAFLKDWSVRTENPHEANMFFIPSLLYYFSSNVGLAAPHLTRVIKYVQREFPYWNRTRGADHFFFATQDRGLCHYHMEELLQESIRLVHFGYYQFNNSLGGMGGKMEACIKPSRDVVVAPNIVNALQVVTKTFNLQSASADPPLPERTKLLFLAGGVRMEDSEYSGGARQQIFRLYNATNSSDPDVKFVEGYVGDYEEQLRTHKFCMAPWGHGWGIRLPQVVLHGCVPVIIQDYVFQFFEDVLPYQDFSVRLSNEDIPHLGPLLRAIDDKEYARLQEGLKKVYRAFHWDEGPEPFGGLAYNLTIRSLMKRYRYRKGKLIQPTEHCNLPPKQPQDCPTPDHQQQQQQTPCPEPKPCPVCLACPACQECPTLQGPGGQEWVGNNSSGTALKGALDGTSTGLGHEEGQSSEYTANPRGAPSLRTLRGSQGFVSGAGMHAVYLLCIMAAFIAGRLSLGSLVKGS